MALSTPTNPLADLRIAIDNAIAALRYAAGNVEAAYDTINNDDTAVKSFLDEECAQVCELLDVARRAAKKARAMVGDGAGGRS